MESIFINWYNVFTERDFYGDDISFSEQFERIEREINKSASIHDCGVTDWSLVINLADEILSKESKDVWVYTYALVAFYHCHGLSAFAENLEKQITFYKEHWEGLFPLIARKSRRLAPFLWLQSQVKQWRKDSQYQATKAYQAIKATQDAQFAQVALDNLHVFLEEKFEREAPTFTGLIGQTDTEQVQINKETQSNTDFIIQENVENDTENQDSKQDTANTPHPNTPQIVQTQTEPLIPKQKQASIVRDIIDNTRLFAQHLLSQNPLDERAYLLHRSALWGTLTQLPYANTEGKTQLSSGIPEDKLHEYRTAFENKQYREILFPLEISTSKSPFWFDGHYMVLKCLEELNAQAPFYTVKSCFLQLLSRFPSLLKYSFNNAMPFASLELQEWVSVEQSSWYNKHSQQTFIENTVKDKEYYNEVTQDKLLQEAMALAQEENFYVGLRHLGKASSGKNKAVFTLGILQAQYCINTRKKDIALQLLEGLFDQLKEWDMLDWEPELTVKILSLLLSCKLKDTSKETIEQKRLLYRLNLDVALNL